MGGMMGSFWTVALRRAASGLAVVIALAGPAAADDRADCQKRSGDLAVAACSRLIARDDKDFRAWAERGMAWLQVNELDRAMADYDRAISLSPHYSYALLGRGMVFTRKRDFDKALSDLNKAIDVEPRTAVVYNLRGVAYMAMGDSDRALADFDMAIALDSTDPESRSNRAAVLLKTGDFDRAIADIDAVINSNASNAEAYALRGRAFSGKGDHDRAIADYDRAIGLSPGEADLHYHRGVSWKRKGENDRALADLDRAVALDPRLADAFSVRGSIWFDKGDLVRAIADFDTALRLDPDDAGTLNMRGFARERLGSLEAALDDLRRAGELDPRLRAGATISRLETAIATRKAAAASEHRVALVIGNAAYAAGGRLKNPVNDARDVSQVLTSLGFDVTLAEDLDRARFGKTLAAFEERASGADAVLFYYAGHGIGLSSESFLIPTDADYRTVGEVKESGIRLSETLERFKGRARVILAFIDACRDTPLVDRLKTATPDQSRSAGLHRGLALLDLKDPDILLVYATTPGQTASDGTGRNSPFAQAFLTFVATPGIEVETLLKRIGRTVMDATNNRQVPERLSRLTMEFYFKPAPPP